MRTLGLRGSELSSFRALSIKRGFTIPQSRACVRRASQLPLHKGARVLTHQCVVSDDSGAEKPRPEKSGRGGNMRDTGNQPLTEPAVTPLMMNLLRQMYTTTTGRMASRMNMYTLPMSNLE